MGKSISASRNRVQQLARIVASGPHELAKTTKPFSRSRVVFPRKGEAGSLSEEKKKERMDSGRDQTQTQSDGSSRMPLSLVVADCAKRWFQDTLREAKSGDVAMQVLVGQMYQSGYGVSADAQKGKLWISRASRCRSSAWKVSDKRPGYNASDSDSNDDLQQ